MSKLDKLLRELCPDGVKYKKLVDAVSIERGKRVVRSQLSISGKYPVYQNSLTPLGYHTDYNYNANTTFIIVAGAAGEIGFSDKAFWAADDCFAVVCPENVLNRYIYHLLLNNQNQLVSKVRKASIPRLSRSAIENLVIPIPPLDVQREIVRILDDYTENITELQRQLTAELTARKTQYGYYRNKFLDFESSVSVKTIGDICDVVVGGEPPTDCIKGDVRDSTHIYPVWGNGKEVYGYSGTYKIDRNAVVISSIGANTGAVYYKEAFFTPIIRLKVILPKDNQINARFLFHALSGTTIKSKSSSVPNMNANEIKAIKIPVPPLDVQNRIVNVLDNFEKICSDLNIGLPAEIEARQKQYEYYRDKLLTFAEAGGTIMSRAEQSRAEQSRAEQSRAEQSRALIKLLQYVFGYTVFSLQDIVKKSCSGGTPKKGVSEYYEGGNIPWLRTQEVVFRDIYRTECFITESAVKNSAAKWIPENCVIVAISGATAGRCAINKIPLTTNQHCLNLEVDPEMALYRYVYYCICAKQEELLAKKEGARGDLNSTRILSLQIDLPSIEEQKRIISILDRFDSICNDLTSGLPAEIEARQRQYEYYRDKLLSFEEKL